MVAQDLGASAEPESAVTRRRGEELRQAIYAATIDELRAVGYPRLTMQGIAAAAGTGKSALYRRWPNRDALMQEALASTLPDPYDTRLTGDARADLISLLSVLQEVLNRSSGTIFQVIAAEVGSETDLLRSLVNERVVRPCTERIAEVLQKSIPTSGPTSREIELRAEVGPAMLTHHCLSGHETTPDEYVADVADLMLRFPAE